MVIDGWSENELEAFYIEDPGPREHHLNMQSYQQSAVHRT